MTAFTLSKLLTLLVYPLSLCLLLCMLALIFLTLRWVRTSFYALLLAIGWLYVCSTALFANFLMNNLERGFVPRAMSVIAPADAIVLLGGATRGDTHMGTLPDLNQQADRLVHAAALYKAGKAPVILLAGGAPAGGRPEAEQMKDILSVMGVPAQHMLLETKSRDTHDNAVFTAQMLKARGVRRVLLVTSAFHMRRSAALFETQGLEVVPAPTDYQQLVAPQVLPNWLPTVSNLSQATYALHELTGYWVYRWRGWL
ncbi:MAG TPA: YdcF family protein [Halioglobus sp.]